MSTMKKKVHCQLRPYLILWTRHSSTWVDHFYSQSNHALVFHFSAHLQETNVVEQYSQTSLSQPKSNFVEGKQCIWDILICSLGQTTREASLTIHGLIGTIVEQEHETIDLRSPAKTMVSTGTMPRTPTMKSAGTMPKTPLTKSTGTMPQTPTTTTAAAAATSFFVSSDQTIDLVSPTIETIDLCSPERPTAGTSSPASSPHLPPQ